MKRLYALSLVASIQWPVGCRRIDELALDPTFACRNVASLSGAGSSPSQWCLDKLALERTEDPSSHSALIGCLTRATSSTAIDGCIRADPWIARKTKTMYEGMNPTAKAKIPLLGEIAKKAPDLKRIETYDVAFSGTIPKEALCVVDAGTLYSMFRMPISEKDRQRPFQRPSSRPCLLMLLGPDGRNAFDFFRSYSFDYEVSKLAHIEYVLVVRTLDWVAPGEPRDKVDSSGMPTAFKVFEPGSYKGDAHLFSLADSKYLGGFATTASSSDATFTNPSQEDLARDLDGNAWAAIRQGVEHLASARSK